MVRTTLELDDDLVAAAKDLARRERTTIGEVISQLALNALKANAQVKVRNGVRVFAPKAAASVPDLRLVNELRDDN